MFIAVLGENVPASLLYDLLWGHCCYTTLTLLEGPVCRLMKHSYIFQINSIQSVPDGLILHHSMSPYRVHITWILIVPFTGTDWWMIGCLSYQYSNILYWQQHRVAFSSPAVVADWESGATKMNVFVVHIPAIEYDVMELYHS